MDGALLTYSKGLPLIGGSPSTYALASLIPFARVTRVSMKMPTMKPIRAQ